MCRAKARATDTALPCPVPGPDALLTADDRRLAAALDAADPLAALRARFELPRHAGGEAVYLCSHRLGLPARQARQRLEAVMAQWAGHGLHGGQQGTAPWDGQVTAVANRLLANLLGCSGEEVVAMASLSTNLHLLLAGFYRPAGRRGAILVEADCFTADRLVIASQLALHGRDPAQDLIVVPADPDTGLVDPQALAACIQAHAGRLALVLWPGVHWRSGQAFDLAAVSTLAHQAGALAGFDLAHAAGNLPLALHDSGADFAVWCGYKHLCGGPGAPAGLFVHARHHQRCRPALAGWWGQREASRYDAPPVFEPTPGAAGWQHSPPSPLALAPLAASLELFAAAGGMVPLAARSARLQARLRAWLARCAGHMLQPLTPAGAGAQLSLRVLPGHDPAALATALAQAGIFVDWPAPALLRLSLHPLYTSHRDLLALVRTLEHQAGRAPVQLSP